jgi:hypothetical protein
MSTRADILKNIRETLEGIDSSKDDSFNTKVDAVESGDISSFDEVAYSIVLGVFVQGFNVGPSLTKSGRKRDLAMTLSVGIRAIIRSTVDDIEETMSDLMGDISQALFDDPRRGIDDLPVDTIQINFGQEFIDQAGGGALGNFIAVVQITWLGDSQKP